MYRFQWLHNRTQHVARWNPEHVSADCNLCCSLIPMHAFAEVVGFIIISGLSLGALERLWKYGPCMMKVWTFLQQRRLLSLSRNESITKFTMQNVEGSSPNIDACLFVLNKSNISNISFVSILWSWSHSRTQFLHELSVQMLMWTLQMLMWTVRSDCGQLRLLVALHMFRVRAFSTSHLPR